MNYVSTQDELGTIFIPFLSLHTEKPERGWVNA